MHLLQALIAVPAGYMKTVTDIHLLSEGDSRINR